MLAADKSSCLSVKLLGFHLLTIVCANASALHWILGKKKLTWSLQELQVMAMAIDLIYLANAVLKMAVWSVFISHSNNV